MKHPLLAAREFAAKYARKYARPTAIIVVFMALGWLTGLNFLAGVVAMAYFNGPELAKRNKAARDVIEALGLVEERIRDSFHGDQYTEDAHTLREARRLLRDAFK